MDVSPFIPVGRVKKAHGLSGEVAVAPSGAIAGTPPEGSVVWFVPPPDGVRTGRVLSSRPTPAGWLLAIEGVNTKDAARALAGSVVLIHRDELADVLAPAETDLTGISVSDEVHGDLGKIVDVIVTGANDVFVVQGPFGEILIPVIDDVVLDLDEDSRTARVKLLRGLLPGEAEEVR